MPRSVVRGAVRPRQQPACSLVEPDFRRRLPFWRTILSAPTEPSGRALSDSRQRLFEPMVGESAAAERVELSLTSNGPRPFRYAARATYALDGGALTMRLWLRNLGPEPLPFGLGFHPWLVRTPQTLLLAKAQRVQRWRIATICLSAKRLSLRAQSGISPRRVSFPRRGSTMRFSAGTATQLFFGQNAGSRSRSWPIRRSRLTSSIRPAAIPTSSVLSPSRISLMLITCLVGRRPAG